MRGRQRQRHRERGRERDRERDRDSERRRGRDRRELREGEAETARLCDGDKRGDQVTHFATPAPLTIAAADSFINFHNGTLVVNAQAKSQTVI